MDTSKLLSTSQNDDEAEDAADDLCLGFVFEDWLDPQLFTSHGACSFSLDGVSVLQGSFCHTPTNDQTGAVVWDDAVMLSRFLAGMREKLAGKKVLDLGAGTGFLGIVVAARCGASAVVSDREVMRGMMEENVARNEGLVRDAGGMCKAIVHEWGQRASEEMMEHAPFDVVLAGGCVYHEEANPLLIMTMKEMAGDDTVIYVAIDFRFDVRKKEEEGEDQYVSPVIKSFLDQAKEAGIVMKSLSDKDIGLPEEQIKKSVKIYECKIQSA